MSFLFCCFLYVVAFLFLVICVCSSLSTKDVATHEETGKRPEYRPVYVFAARECFTRLWNILLQYEIHVRLEKCALRSYARPKPMLHLALPRKSENYFSDGRVYAL